MKRIAILVVVGLLLFGAGLGGGVHWGKQQIARLDAGFRKDFTELRQRLEGAQRRVADERVRTDQMQRRTYELETELETFKEELAAQDRQRQNAVGASLREIEKLRSEVAASAEDVARGKITIDQMQIENQRLTQQLAQASEERKTVQAQNDEARNRLKISGQHLDRCLGHNAEMARVASEVLDAYENKGVFSSLLEKEPITGFKQVEVEHLIQNYRRDISQNALQDAER
ncbi:MAG: hypothetical protein A2X84_12780 [Desulfuromonadaceae bacterium GWC2_58_13]|nr:MAG: hypothetical protein A2X84_12780 [Desulfuromonadaceae bacterium GWC2_58_13]